MKNEKGATSLEILLTIVILLIIAGTAIAMISGSFETEEQPSNTTTNQVQNENLNITGEEQNKTTEDEV